MAKEKFVFETELDIKGISKSAKDAQKQIREIANEAKAMSKNAQITGNVKMKAEGIDKTNQALKMAENNVKQLTQGLSEAKLNGATEKQIAGLESQLRKASTQAVNLGSDLAKASSGNVSQNFSNVTNSAKTMGSNLLGIGSKIGNIFSGVQAGVSMVQGAFSTVSGYVTGFAGRLMGTYDEQVQAQKTLSATLSDGAKGYQDFNSHIEQGNALLKSQKGDLNEIASTLSSYTQMTGDEAFKTVNAINAIGDSLSVNTEGQKQFSVGLAQAMGSGALHAQDFNQMMQTALGADFKKMLIDAANQMAGVAQSTEEMKKSLEGGNVKKDTLSNLLGDDWAKKMAEYQTKAKGVEVSTGGVSRMLKEGSLSAKSFSDVFGKDFIQKLTDAQNAQGGMVVTQENFKSAMEGGVFTTDVMTQALQNWQEKGKEVASGGASTFEQIKEMVTKGFDQSALAGFQKRMGDSGVDMATLGDQAGMLASTVGTNLGQIGADAVKYLTQFIDSNGDGKVSAKEFGDKANEVRGQVSKFLGQVGASAPSFFQFIGDVGNALGELGNFIRKVNDATSGVNDLIRAVGKMSGKTGLLGKALGIRDNKGWGDAFSDFHWLNSPLSSEHFGDVGTGLGQKLYGSRANLMPLNLQHFASPRNLSNVNIPSGLSTIGQSVGARSTDNSTSNTIGDIIIQGGSGNSKAIADEIYRRLARNGVKLNRR